MQFADHRKRYEILNAHIVSVQAGGMLCVNGSSAVTQVMPWTI